MYLTFEQHRAARVRKLPQNSIQKAFYGAMKLSKTELIFCSRILKEWV